MQEECICCGFCNGLNCFLISQISPNCRTLIFISTQNTYTTYIGVRSMNPSIVSDQFHAGSTNTVQHQTLDCSKHKRRSSNASLLFTPNFLHFDNNGDQQGSTLLIMFRSHVQTVLHRASAPFADSTLVLYL